MEPKPKKWYQKKRYLLPIGILGIALLASASGGGMTQTTVPQGSSYTAPPTPATASYTSQDSANLSNDNSYVNTYGNTVHSPAYSTDNNVPAGASAQCGDGTYSFSQSRRGTCSHHGGVAEWLH
jgi:hypothetical protein